MELGFDDELEEARKAVEELMRRAQKESCRRQKAEEEMAASLHKVQPDRKLDKSFSARQDKIKPAL